MPGPDDIRTRLRDFILSEFLHGEDPTKLSNGDPLFTAGVLDSIAATKLVSYLEVTWGVEVEAHEVDVDNIDTIDRAARFVERKLAD